MTYEVDIIINSHVVEIKKLKPKNEVIWQLVMEKHNSKPVWTSLLYHTFGNKVSVCRAYKHHLDMDGFDIWNIIAVPNGCIRLVSPDLIFTYIICITWLL